MKLNGYHKYILVLIFLANADVIYFMSNQYNKLDSMFDFLIFLAGIGIAGSVGSKAMDKFGKRGIEP